MSTDDIELYLDGGDSCYLESLVKARLMLNKVFDVSCPLCTNLENLILMEIELATLGAEKAKSEILKAHKNNVVPIKTDE